MVQDYTQAASWFRQAADRGLTLAQCRLGMAYESGQGVVRDAVEAYAWALVAAAYGEPAYLSRLDQRRQTTQALLEKARLGGGPRSMPFTPAVVASAQTRAKAIMAQLGTAATR